MKKFSIDRLLWAAAFIAVGLILFANEANILDVNVLEILIKLWPVFILIPGVTSLSRGQYFWGTSLVFIGGLFLLSNFTNVDLWGYMFPVIIIAVGISMLFKPRNWNSFNHKGDTTTDLINESAIFSGVEKQVSSKTFKGGTIDAVFGSVELDLRKAKLDKEGAKIEANAVFGAVEILINPGDYNIVTSGTAIFGGWSGATSHKDKEKPTLEITGAAVFGAVEVK